MTAIEWTDETWNPVRGCTKVSPGCKHCYAETFAERFRGVPGHPYERGFDPRIVPDALDKPLRWQRPRRVFVNSMSDLFGEFVPDEYVARVFGVMRSAERHVFQVLTKRSARMMAWFQWAADPGRAMDLAVRTGFADPPLPNVHLGVSVENRRYGLPRIEHLRATPAAVRFLSIEPLLEDLGELDLTDIHWVIVGGESGFGARPMHPGWVRSIRDQCVAAGVPFFFKQWGGWKAVDDEPRASDVWVLGDKGHTQRWKPGDRGSDPGRWDAFGDALMRRHAHKADAGRVLDGRTWDEMPGGVQ